MNDISLWCTGLLTGAKEVLLRDGIVTEQEIKKISDKKVEKLINTYFDGYHPCIDGGGEIIYLVPKGGIISKICISR